MFASNRNGDKPHETNVFIADWVESDPTENISEDHLRKTVTYLASDELKGRLTGSEGAKKASEYLASEFKKLKLKSFVGKLVYDAKTAGTVIQELEKINISNVDIDYAEYSKIEQLKNILRRKASLKAKEIAKSMIEPLGQKVGNIIYASDKTQI